MNEIFTGADSNPLQVLLVDILLFNLKATQLEKKIKIEHNTLQLIEVFKKGTHSAAHVEDFENFRFHVAAILKIKPQL